MIVSPSRGDRHVWPLVLALLAACACGARMKATKAQWDEARAIAERHAEDTYHAPPEKVYEANPRLPFLFDAALPGHSWVLVHRGKVINGGGLKGLGSYLDEIDAYADRALVADDLTDLLYVFGGFPPVDPAAISPESYYTDDDPELAMRATWHDHALELRLAYQLRFPSNPDIAPSEDTSDTWEMTVSFWTLHLRKGTVPTWTEERRELTRKREHIDED